MRILFVTPYYIPAWGFGGPVKVVADLAQALRRRGHQVSVATTDAFDRQTRMPKRQDIVDGIPVWYFPNVSNAAAFRWNVYFPRGFRSWLKQHINEFDIIHCHDFYTGLNIIVSRVAKQAGVPYLIQPHGALIPVRRQAKLFWVKRLWLLFFSHVLGDATKIVVSTKQERQEVIDNQGLDGQRVAVIPNGLDKSSVRRPARNEDQRVALGVNPSGYVILYFGRIQFIKGIDISLRAVAQLKQLPWKFFIVGRDDGQQPALEALVQKLKIGDRVQFVGPKFGSDLDVFLGFSDAFILNSRAESFPMSVLNACAAGLPLIISSECRVPEIGQWGAGIVLDQNTPEATTGALQQLLPDAARREQMSQAGQRLVREVFSLQRVVGEHLKLYQQLLSS